MPTSPSLILSQQKEPLDQILSRPPESSIPVLHSGMGWQYQHAAGRGRLREAGIAQSLSRKGTSIDNGITERVFGT